MLTNLRPSTMNICNEVSHKNQDVKPTDGMHMNAVKEEGKELWSWEVAGTIILMYVMFPMDGLVTAVTIILH